MGEGVRRTRLLAWAVCAALVPVSVAWAQAPGRTAEQGRCLLGERVGMHVRD